MSRFTKNIVRGLQYLGFFVKRHQMKNVTFGNKQNVMNLTQEEWAEQSANDDHAVILDVRTDQEVEEGHIPHSIHIDIYRGQGFIDEVEKLDKNKNYYIYCRSGNRSGQACAIFDQLGFENAYNLMGGFMEWEGEVVE